MENRKKNKVRGQEEKPEKEKSTGIGILKDRRFHQIFGLFLAAFSIFLIVAFTSYLSNWKSDFSEVHQPTWADFKDAYPEMTSNAMGLLGAYLAHVFIYKWFGVSAYLVAILMLCSGFQVAIGKRLFSFFKYGNYTLFSLVWIALFFAFVSENPVLGGSVGFETKDWLQGLVGNVGIFLVLLFTLLSFLTWVFNLSLASIWAHMPKFSRSSKQSSKTTTQANTSTPQNAGMAAANQQSTNVVKEKTTPNNATETTQTAPPEATSSHTSAADAMPETPPTAPSTTNEAAEKQEAAPKATEDKSTEQERKPTTAAKKAPEPPQKEDDFEVVYANNAPTASPQEEAPSAKKPLQDKEEHPDFEVAANSESTAEESSDEQMVREDYDPTLDLSNYQYPPISILREYENNEQQISQEDLEDRKEQIVNTLQNYSIKIDKIKANVGPTVTLYEIIPAPGVRISKIKNLENDIALSLAALGIRIIAPIPGKGTIGIEVPNPDPQMVSLKTVFLSDKFKSNDMALPIGLGKTISNEVYITDLAKMPHLLIAGATGQGKSVGLNVIIASLLYKKHPSQIKFVLVDPKKVELSLFNRIEKHFLAKLPDNEEAIITDTDLVVDTLNSLCVEMDKRYDLLKDAGVRNIKEYNAKYIKRKLNPNKGHDYMPYIVLIIDELADLMMTAGKEVEMPIARLAQLARAIGIHLILATQRPSVNIITGTIKANFPARIAFRVTSRVDSRTILDAGGADQLIGRGDMLLTTGGSLTRLQCAFIDTDEVNEITEFIGDQVSYPSAFELPDVPSSGGDGDQQSADDVLEDLDAQFEEAARIIVQHQQGSTSLLQRRLKLGYNRAGRIIDQLENAGVVGPFEGSKARQVLIPDEYSLEQLLNSLKAENKL